jgi:cyclophilin family peptidyl-prolyl cis-trans isomerase
MPDNNNINEASFPIVINSITDLSVPKNAANTTIDLFNSFDDPSTTGKVASFELYNTSLAGGIINVLLFDQAQTGAPLTVKNFLNYVNDGDYTNSIIHRSVSNFIIQGGGFTINDLNPGLVPADPPVQNEFSVDRSNLRGTIAMAKLGGNPNSATNQWFFNLNDNSSNLDNQNGGFTVFGQVLSPTDLNVIDAISKIPIFNGSSINPAFTELPLSIDPQNPQIKSDSDYVRFKSVSVANLSELTFGVVSNSNPDLVNVIINNDRLTLDYQDNQSGSAEISIRATNLLGNTIDDTFIVTVATIEPLKLSNFQSSISGFTVDFNQQLNLDLLNLYDGSDETQDSSDLRVLDANNREVKGSLILNRDTNNLTFVKTGKSLEDGNYTVNLFSRNDSFVDNNGGVLDGNDDGQTGDNYTQSLTIDKTNTKVLSLPDFSRAPNESINLGDNQSPGIPISLSDGSGVTQVDFTFAYNADLLGISGVNLAANLVDSWQITQDLTIAGIAKISIQGNTSLSAGENNLLSLTATVPETATYGTSAVLQLKDVRLNGSNNGVIGDEAIQQVALLGDISGNGVITSLDAALAARIALGLDSGSDKFPNTDPLIFGDSDFDGSLSNLDALTIAKTSIGLS